MELNKYRTTNYKNISLDTHTPCSRVYLLNEIHFTRVYCCKGHFLQVLLVSLKNFVIHYILTCSFFSKNWMIVTQMNDCNKNVHFIVINEWMIFTIKLSFLGIKGRGNESLIIMVLNHSTLPFVNAMFFFLISKHDEFNFQLYLI